MVKIQTLGEQGAVLEQVAFTELQLDAPVSMDKLKQAMRDTRGYEVIKPALKKTTAEAQGWRLKEAIPGFQSMSCHTRETGQSLAPRAGPHAMGFFPMAWLPFRSSWNHSTSSAIVARRNPPPLAPRIPWGAGWGTTG